METSNGGWPIWRSEYYPFGTQQYMLPTANNYKFATLERDSESDLDHATFRQYSPLAGRWMSPDPYNGSYDLSNPQSFNRYAYVSNSPLMYTDPSGENPLGIIANIGLCFGGTNPGGCIAEVTAGPVGWVTLGVSAILEGLDIAGVFGGHPAFHGSLKPRPNVPNGGNVQATVTQGPVLPSGNGTFTMTMGYSVPVYTPSAPLVEIPSIPWAQIGAGVASAAEKIPAVAASALLLNMKGDNSMSQSCRAEWTHATDYCSQLMNNPGRAPNVWGGSFESCRRGQVSQACGGNRVN